MVRRRDSAAWSPGKIVDEIVGEEVVPRSDARDRVLNIISLGAGVQSTTMALMAASGEITPMPDCAIFADTQSEPAGVYRHLEWLMSPGVLPFPVHVTSIGSLRDEVLLSTKQLGKRGSHARPPFYVESPEGKIGMIRRQCTGDYKIDPIEKKVRELIGVAPRRRWPRVLRVVQWIGISIDEAHRMKPSHRVAVRNRWPLVEAHRSRWDCLEWLEKNGYPTPPKSACTFCPYRSDREWRRIRDQDPGSWAEAVEMDRAIRGGLAGAGFRGQLFVHRSCVPLEDVDLSTPAERGVPVLFDVDAFGNECEGVCGV